MKPKTIYFVSGVSGVGKTSVMEHLKLLLPTRSFEVHDFDERGVPAGADHVWRINETKYWIGLGQQKAEQGIGFVVCGIANPDEIAEMQNNFPAIKVEIILLDADDDVIEQRLRGRNQNADVKADLERVVGSAEEFIKNNRNFAGALREICQKHQCQIIDTTNIKPEEVAKKVVELIGAK